MDEVLKETLERAERNIENPECMNHIGPLYQSGYVTGVKDMIKMIREAYGCSKD